MAKKQFKAESKRLLDLMINSIYTHKEIFLRELISNASDAEDKLAYKALTDDQVPVDRSELKITIVPDKEMRTLTVSDNGVGMSPDLVRQLNSYDGRADTLGKSIGVRNVITRIKLYYGDKGDIRFDFELLCTTSGIHRLGISAHGNRKSGNHYYNLLFEKLHITYFEIFNALSIT